MTNAGDAGGDALLRQKIANLESKAGPLQHIVKRYGRHSDRAELERVRDQLNAARARLYGQVWR